MREALRAGAPVRELFVAEPIERWSEVVTDARDSGVPVVSVPERVLAALCDTTTPQGLVAVVEAPPVDLEHAAGEASLVVVLAAVRDPGNAGTLVRCAVAAGAEVVVFLGGAVDALHPKTLRASAGYMWRIPVVRTLTLERCVAQLKLLGLTIVGTDAAAPRSITDGDLTRPLAVVLGNEAWGLPAEEAEMIDEAYSIPMPGPVESLNVAMAGAIFLFEAVRQRAASR